MLTIDAHLKNDALTYLNEHKFEFLQAFVKVWDNYSMYVKLLDKMFDYLNRYYIKNHTLITLG
jgi:hypothetical protein